MQRALFAHHLRLIEAQLCENPTHRNPECQVVRDGHAALKVATRFGVVNVQRQVLECRTCGEHFIPMNALLPEHNGMVITKGLQEMACLFSLSSSYEGATRLVGEFCHDPDVLCAREIELLVNQHGANVRQQEAERAKAMENTPDVNPETVSQHLKDLSPSRRKVWPEEVQEAVNRALERPEIEEIPFGLPKRDWDRIVEHVRGNWNSTEELDPLLLANLGPKPQEGEAVIFADGIVIHGRGLYRRPEETIVVLRMGDKGRYFSGTRDEVIHLVKVWVKALKPTKITIVGDGARWIREGLYGELAGLGDEVTLVLDWYHLRKKVGELLSMVCNRKKHRNAIMDEIQPLLWNGKVDETIDRLRVLLPEPRNPERFEELLSYLEARKPAIKDYNVRRINREYNGNGVVEKANDILVARRQKGAGMSWSIQGSDTLCALTTLWHNGEWDTYWTGQLAA